MARMILRHEPSLRDPVLLVGFAGWANAAGISLDVISQLQSLLATDSIGTLDAPECYVITNPSTANRPITTIRSGLVEELRFPVTEIHALHEAGTQPDLLLMQGVEPDLYWQEFTDAIWSVITRFSVSRVYTIGSYLDHIPHTRPPRISAVVTDPRLKAELRPHHVDFTGYEGPTSIQTFLLWSCQQRQVEGISLWGGVPTYLQGTYPKGVLQLLSILSNLVGVTLDTTRLQAWAADFENALQKQLAKNEEMATFVKQLERAYDKALKDTDLLRGDEMVEEIQQFLRRRTRSDSDPHSSDQPQ
ncbi:MAG: PAC2 family protein [Nitrospinae bacterium]|nr:PAC2 family protein [Nitrospinota bacterium]